MDAVADATAAVARLIPIGGTPAKGADGKVIYPYGVYSVTLGRGDSYTLNSRHGLRRGRVVAQTFGKTAEAALTHMDEITERLLDEPLLAEGYECTPCRLELDPAVVRDPDDQTVIGVTATFDFTATKETP